MNKFDLRTSVNVALEQLAVERQSQTAIREKRLADIEARHTAAENQQAALRLEQEALQERVLGLVSMLALQTVEVLAEHGKIPFGGRHKLRRCYAAPVQETFTLYDESYHYDEVNGTRRVEELEHVLGLTANGKFFVIDVDAKDGSRGGNIDELAKRVKARYAAEIGQVVDLGQLNFEIPPEEQPLVSRYQDHLFAMTVNMVANDAVPACMRIDRGPFNRIEIKTKNF